MVPPNVQHPVTALNIAAKMPITGFLDGVGIDEDNGAIWISNRDRNRPKRVDPTTNHLVGLVAVGRIPCSGIGVGHGGVWVPNCGDQTVARVNARNNHPEATTSVDIADSGGLISLGEGERKLTLPERYMLFLTDYGSIPSVPRWVHLS